MAWRFTLKHLVPAKQISIEFSVANSRFISTIAPAISVDEAKAIIKKIKGQYADASHNVPVYQIGTGQSVIAHSSDDGEPSGTAGRPALAVLQGSGLGDTVIVITRYFGGTKLGTGGLVKAYSQAARLAIEAVPKAEKTQVTVCRFHVEYPQFEQLDRILRDNKASIMNKEFGEVVQIDFMLRKEDLSNLESIVADKFHGRIKVEIVEAERTELIPQ